MADLNYSRIHFSISPRSWGSQTLAQGGNTYDVYGAYSDTMWHSVNSPITLQVIWENTTPNTLYQAQEGTGTNGERVTGDLVSVLFDIYEGTTAVRSGLNTVNDFNKLCTIRKSKDVRKVWPGRPDEATGLTGHRFTVDISQVLADLLSYSLVPVNIGTWGGVNDTASTGPTSNGNSTPNLYGGLNGQWTASTVATTNTERQYNETPSGVERRIRIRARFEILAADGTIEMSTVPAARSCADFNIINSAPQWGDRHNMYEFENGYVSANKNFCTNSPNVSSSTSSADLKYNVAFKKIRLDDEAEYIQWLQRRLPGYNTSSNTCTGLALKVETSEDKDFASIYKTVYMIDAVMDSRARESNTVNILANSQDRAFMQNISPDYINKCNNGSNLTIPASGYVTDPITSTYKYYRVSVANEESGTTEIKTSKYAYFELDEEAKGNWSDVCGMKEGVKFFWVNRYGAIDSYVAKRNFLNSVDVSQNTITKISPDRGHIGNTTNTGAPYSNDIGANIYPHSREVLNINANRGYQVTTDPLTQAEAKWFEELLTSPNVWVLQENGAYTFLNSFSGYNTQRPSNAGYVPILITNSGTTLIDESKGLSQVTIEFIESHEINTQRN